MKTNLGIETTDEERVRIASNLGLKHKSATRNDIKEAINEYVKNVLLGGPTTDSEPVSATEPAVAQQATAIGGGPIGDFVPSRGDERYMYKGQDESITKAASGILDRLELIQNFVWEALERNRA